MAVSYIITLIWLFVIYCSGYYETLAYEIKLALKPLQIRVMDEATIPFTTEAFRALKHAWHFWKHLTGMMYMASNLSKTGITFLDPHSEQMVRFFLRQCGHQVLYTRTENWRTRSWRCRMQQCTRSTVLVFKLFEWMVGKNSRYTSCFYDFLYCVFCVCISVCIQWFLCLPDACGCDTCLPNMVCLCMLCVYEYECHVHKWLRMPLFSEGC